MRIAADDDDDIGIAVLVGSSAAGAVLVMCAAAGDAWRNIDLALAAAWHSVWAVRASTRQAICHAKTNSAAAVPRIRVPVVGHTQ